MKGELESPQQELYRSILQTAMDGYWLADLHGRLLEVNDAYCRMSGYRPQELLAMRIAELEAEETAGDNAAHIRKIMTRGEDRFESRHRRKDGSEFDVEVSVQYRPIEGGRLVAFLRDITERKQAQETLRASEARLRAIIDISPVPMALNDDNQRITFLNAAFVETYGYGVDEIPTLGAWWPKAYPDPAYRAWVAEAWQGELERVKRAGVNFSALEVIVRCKDGTDRTVLASAASISNRFEGQHLVVLYDITRRKQAEEALRKSEATLSEVIRAVPQSIFWKDRHCVYVGCNDVFARAAGLSDPKSIAGMTDFDLPWPRAEADAYRADDRLVMESGQLRLHIVEPLQQADGSRLWIDTTKVPLRSADGRVNGVLGVFEDITERKRAEEALRKSEAQFAAAFDMNPLATNLVALATGRIIEVNERYCQFFGYTRDEVVGRTVPELQMWAEPTLRDALMQRVRNEGSVRDYEARLRRKDGTVRDVLLSVAVVDYLGAAEPVFLSMLTDVTGKKAMEAQLLQNQRMEVIGSLAGGIAHDLNNILAPIMMVGGLLKGKLHEPEDQDTLEMALSGVRRGADIIKQLLTFSRGQRGERVAVQIRYLIREVMQMMRETFPHEIDLHSQVASDLWTVVADSTQLHQVLLNLCVNARDAMRQGGRLTIAASNTTLAAGDEGLPADEKPGPYVVLEVSDTGHGIPPEIQHRIFDLFFTTKPVGEGTGLGLSTVLGIVQNHGGFIRLSSSPGKGSSFKVFLPACPDATEETVQTPLVSPVGHRGGQTILVVDDERSVREATRILLERQSFQVFTAIHGDDALAQFLRHRDEIKLVLTDVMMPVMNGVSLVRALRALDPALKIIAASGLGDAAHAKELAELGVLELMMKPYSGTTLIEVVHRHLAPP